jgi:hypothetical protein
MSLAGVAAGCAHVSSSQVVAPDGGSAHRITCEFLYECADEAHRLCPAGDKLLSLDNRETGAVAITAFFGNVAITRIRSDVDHVAVVRCE